MAIEGIDIYQGDGGIDWSRVATGGKGFTFVRAAYGSSPDKLVVQNFVGAKHQGLKVGLYQFYRATISYKKQIVSFMDTVTSAKIGYGAGDLAPVLDIEDNPHYDGPWDVKNNAAFIQGIKDWIIAVKSKFNCDPILYTRASFWKVLGNPTGFSQYPLWVANYQNANGKPAKPTLPTGWSNWAFWQYTDSGLVTGINHSCCLDRFNGATSDLKGYLIQ